MPCNWVFQGGRVLRREGLSSGHLEGMSSLFFGEYNPLCVRPRLPGISLELLFHQKFIRCSVDFPSDARPFFLFPPPPPLLRQSSSPDPSCVDFRMAAPGEREPGNGHSDCNQCPSSAILPPWPMYTATRQQFSITSNV